MAIPSTADIFQAKSETLASLLPDIHAHKAALPNFQRKWVWEPHMVKDLIVSVANRYPAGSLLTMPNSGDKFALRPFSGSGQDLRVIPHLMVLDGQQRLTSLYQSLYSKEGIRDRKGGSHFIYLDVNALTKHPTDITQQESTFADCVFVVSVNKQGQRLRYRGVRDFDDLSSFEDEVERGALPLYVVFNPDDLVRWRDKFVEGKAGNSIENYKELLNKWDLEVTPWLSNIRDYRFPVIELNRDMELHAICHIFEKVNSTGVALTVFELCTAVLWAQGLRLNEIWAHSRSELENAQVLRMQGPLEGAMFLQVISLLATLTRKRDSADVRVSVSCRREDLLKLNRETVETWWGCAQQALRDASKFMESQGIIAQRILPYSTMLLPLAAILGFQKHQAGNASFGQAWPKIERWYWCSVFSQRFSSAVEVNAALDFEQVISWIEGGDEPDVVRTFGFSADRLQEINNIRNAMYKGILCLLAKAGARDFGGEGMLSVNLFYDTHQDHHHIFPANALSKLGISDQRANSIVNRTLIGASANRSIGGRLPSAYVETMRSRLGVELAHEIIRSHLVAPDALLRDSWEEFFLARREELKLLIQTTCGGQMQDFSDGKRLALPRDLERLANDVSEIELRLRSLIASVIEEDWRLIPDHVRTRTDERIAAEERENPQMVRSQVVSASGRLRYSDLRSLEQTIVNGALWPRFADYFGTKEMVSIRFRQLSPLRNANAHLREVDELVRADAEAAVIWFRSSLARGEAMREDQPVDIPVEEEVDDADDSEFIA